MIASSYPCVRAIQRQVPTLTYVDADSVVRSYTFDFLVLCNDGRRVAVSFAANADHEARLQKIFHYATAQGLIGTSLLGEKRCVAEFARTWNHCQASSRSVEVARAILASRERFGEGDVQELLRLIETMPKSIRFSAMVDGASDSRKRHHSIWHLVDLQLLQLIQSDYGDLENLTFIRS